MKRVFEKVLNFLFPTTCLFCKTGNTIVCEKCFLSIPKKINFQNNILSIYSFKDSKVNKLLWRLKYHHSHDIAKLFGKVLAEELSQNNFPKIILIPVPLNKGDKRIHNHAELLANSIKENLEDTDVSVILDLLIKNSKHKQAWSNGKRERFENIKNSITLNPKIDLDFLNRDAVVILVDDVTTTGATIEEVRKVIGKNLLAITIAH